MGNVVAQVIVLVSAIKKISDFCLLCCGEFVELKIAVRAAPPAGSFAVHP
jgi:hypothetical protein